MSHDGAPVPARPHADRRIALEECRRIAALAERRIAECEERRKRLAVLTARIDQARRELYERRDRHE